ncbi:MULTISPECIES: hypothetical protein [Buttiauxella]|uniref:hypothetical protein n=1 Tax=Buttiauxella TaxID=82976 RepID=UPI00105FEEB1|nr:MULTISPECIES: hypothetical protein [Buttiauxella]MCE0826394.1 hypothetical protein [Buttiauxella ferragutiae]TDN50632.1 hypothetical protein EC843_105115 [Buttiauxella sp. JUb87]
MKLQEIKGKVSSLPTIMDISDELLTIKYLMSIESEDLTENTDDLKSVINSLELSHTDSGFMELTEENESIFLEFCCWLKKVDSEFNLGLNANTIDSFSLTTEDIKKMMP